MRVKHSGLGCILVSSLAFFSSCKRELLTNDPTNKTTETAQPGLKTGLAAAFTGAPHDMPVRMAVVSTVVGRPGGSPLFREPSAVATDINGNIYLADQDNNQIRKYDFSGLLLALWGANQAGYVDGNPAQARFNAPSGVAVGPDGQVFVADLNNNRIRVISADGLRVSTFAGSGVAKFNDGQGTLASFNKPSGVAVDAGGQVFVADFGNNMIRRINPTGGVTRWVGQVAAGYIDQNGSLAAFNGPQSITVAPDGTAYVTDINNQRIRKIRAGNVTTLAGNGAAGPNDGTGASAEFNFPAGITSDANGDLYVTDKGSDKGASAIRFVTKTGVVKTVAGGVRTGYNDSYDINAQFSAPTGIAIDYAGNIFVADRLNQSIRKIIFINAVKTLAGNGQLGYREGGGSGAIIETPSSVATGPDGSVYVVDGGTRIRKITPDGTTSLVAGNGHPGFQDGPAAQAQFSTFTSLVVGRDGTIYVADQLNHRIRKISNGVVSTLAGNGRDVIGTGQTGTNAGVGTPAAITMTNNGDLFVATAGGAVIRVSTTGTPGVVTLEKAIPFAKPFDDPSFQPVNGIAIDGSGNVYVSTKLHTIYGYGPNQNVPKIVIGGYDINRNFTLPNFDPTNITFEPFTGRLYMTEGTSFRISSMPSGLNPINNRPGTVAGTGAGGDIDAPVLSAQFLAGQGGRGGIAISSLNAASGIIYFADGSNNKVKQLSR